MKILRIWIFLTRGNFSEMRIKVSTHLNDIGDDFSIGRKCLSVNRISAEFLRANGIGAV